MIALKISAIRIKRESLWFVKIIILDICFFLFKPLTRIRDWRSEAVYFQTKRRESRFGAIYIQNVTPCMITLNNRKKKTMPIKLIDSWKISNWRLLNLKLSTSKKYSWFSFRTNTSSQLKVYWIVKAYPMRLRNFPFYIGMEILSHYNISFGI